MQYFVTVSSKDILRIADGEGASLTFRLRKDDAQVLFISVPESDRRNGRGRALLLSSEKLLVLRGIKRIYADFVNEIEGDEADVGALLKSAGYGDCGKADILAIATRIVLYDPSVKRALETGKPISYFISLSDLSVSQMSSALAFLKSIKADVSCYDIAHMNGRLSGVVLDGAGEPIAMILCSDNGDDLHVDALISKANSDSVAVLIAILGMINSMKASGAEFVYKRVTMVGYNSQLTKLIRRTLSSDTELEVIGKAVSMCKEIGKGASASGSVSASSAAGADSGSATKHEYKAARDDFMEKAWERELIHFPLQKNVTWKGPWSRF